MKYTIDYVPISREDDPLPAGDHRDWLIAPMAIYRTRKNVNANDMPSGSYRLFFPPNPWDALEKTKVNQSFTLAQLLA